MIYLSQLLLDPACPQVQAELRDPYQMHRTLSKAFGDGPDSFSAARCLFRVDGLGEGQLRVLVQSLVSPDWSGLTGSDSYLLEHPHVKEFEPAFTAGQRLAFRLHANPTVKRKGKRLGLYREEEQLAWLHRKAQAGGFGLLTTIPRRPETWRFQTKRGEAARLHGVTFDGQLQVTDSDRLAATVASGLGSGKAFGFGLLSLARG